MTDSKPEDKKTKTNARKIYGIVSTVIAALIFIFLVCTVAVVLWQRSSGGDSSIFGYYMFDVVTDSMEPAIEAGEVIISKKVDDPSALKVGDIITFIAPSGSLKGRNVTHRIVKIVMDDNGVLKHFRTRGDNPSVGEDNWNLNPEAVKAVYVKSAPFIAGLRDFLSHWYGYVVLIVLPLCAVGVMFIAGYVRDKTKLIAAEQAEKKPHRATLDELSEEDKRKLADEFLKGRKAEGSDDESDGLSEENAGGSREDV